jgi:acyl-CoA synthetase (AMP-forming)/AMP-acid ligase II
MGADHDTFQELIDSFDSTNFILYNDTKTTFSELKNQIYLYCNLFEENNFRNKTVAICCPDSIEFLIIFFALIQLKCRIVLINPRYPKDKITQVIDEYKIATIIFSLKNTQSPIDYTEVRTSFKEEFIIFSSGSVASKGICINNSIIKFIKNTSSIPRATGLVNSTLYHMNGLRNCFLNLIHKNNFIILDNFDLAKITRILENYDLSYLNLFPYQILAIKNTKKVFHRVKRVVISSAPVNINILNLCDKIFPNAKVSIGYGSTELGSNLFDNQVPAPRLSVGREHRTLEYRINNGILEIKNKQSISNNLKLTDDGFFVTNDFFTKDQNGYYYYQGRADNMFFCGADKIFPNLIENLINNISGVIYSVVIGVDDNLKGKKPYAFVITKKPGDLILKELQKLLPFNQCPRKIIVINNIPLNDVGKINLQVLEAMIK